MESVQNTTGSSAAARHHGQDCVPYIMHNNIYIGITFFALCLADPMWLAELSVVTQALCD